VPILHLSYPPVYSLTDASEALRQEAERVQASGALGESRLRRLFDYLVENSLAGQSPKEVAIAIDVFGKTSDFDAAQDALVRVYIHKLRKALDEFYSSRGEPGARLHLPRGDYRLQLSTPPPALPGPEKTRNRRVGLLRVLVVLIAAVMVPSARRLRGFAGYAFLSLPESRRSDAAHEFRPVGNEGRAAGRRGLVESQLG
jgi:hypothetical protein